MSNQKQLLLSKKWLPTMVLVTCILFLTGCAFSPWKENRFNEYSPEERVAESMKVFNNDPNNAKARQDVLLAKESAINELITEAEQARMRDDYAAAIIAYDRVLSIDSENRSAILGKKAIADAQKNAQTLAKASEHVNRYQLKMAKKLVHEVLLENPLEEKALSLNSQIDEKTGISNTQPPELKSSFRRPISLEFTNANINEVFNTLSNATGINFILDKDINTNTQVSIYVKNLPVEDAIEMVLSSNGLQKKALSTTTALIYPTNAKKLKDYKELIIRNFYLSNTTAKQAATLINVMLKTNDIYIDERLNMLVIRDTPEVVRLAEKLIAANDIADSEVMLEIEILEVSRSRLQQLGITYPDQLSVLTTSARGLTLDALKNLNSTTIGVSPNPAINFKKTSGDVNLLSNPRIRVKNNEKANILVGDKVPIITTTTTANVGVSESVNYVDVGLKLEVEPQITLDNHVNIKVGLEVSSLGEKTITSTGSTVYRIGTRNTNTVLRLKNGETQILAGLISDEERKTANKVPGVGDIPLLGRLFSDQEDTKNKTEIILAITPKVISNIELPKAEFSEYWSGTHNLITDKPLKSIPQPGLAQENRKRNATNRLRRQQMRDAQRKAQPKTERPANKEQEPRIKPINEQLLQPPTNNLAPKQLPGAVNNLGTPKYNNGSNPPP